MESCDHLIAIFCIDRIHLAVSKVLKTQSDCEYRKHQWWAEAHGGEWRPESFAVRTRTVKRRFGGRFFQNNLSVRPRQHLDDIGKGKAFSVRQFIASAIKCSSLFFRESRCDRSVGWN